VLGIPPGIAKFPASLTTLDCEANMVNTFQTHHDRRVSNRTWAAARLIGFCGLFLATLLWAGDDPEAKTRARLEWLPRNQTGMLNVTAGEGAFLREQVIKVKAKRALEIGTSNGYSSTWIALGCRQTGGHLTTVEIDDAKVKLATENFRAAGVDSLITLVHGDALREVPRLQGPFEFVFIDAWKQDYVKYLAMVLPMVPPGGVIMAHNTTDSRSQMMDFIERIQTDPQLKTTFVDAGPGGFSVSVKQAPK
jgi:predicted O-methyltransferase YrrM